MTTSISLLKRALLFYQSFSFLSRTFLKFFIVCFEAFRSSHATLMNFSTVHF